MHKWSAENFKYSHNIWKNKNLGTCFYVIDLNKFEKSQLKKCISKVLKNLNTATQYLEQQKTSYLFLLIDLNKFCFVPV